MPPRSAARLLSVFGFYALCALCATNLRTACFHDTPERGATAVGIPTVQTGWGVRGSNPEPTD